MGGGGGFGGGGGAPSVGASLARLVRGLDMLQKAQGKAITPDQAKALLPMLKEVKGADKLPTDAAEKQIAAIQKVLTPEQKQAVEYLQPQRSRGGGTGAGGGGFGGGGGARPDRDRPFASERNQKALDSLIAEVGR